MVLHDWNEGKIPYYTLPPARDQSALSEAKIVNEYGKEFNIEEVYITESSFIGSPKSVNDFDPVEVPPSYLHSYDQNMAEEDELLEPLNRGYSDVTENDGIEDDESMCVEDEDSDRNKERALSRRQNEKLYAAEGILNPKAKKAEKKKKENKSKIKADGSC